MICIGAMTARHWANTQGVRLVNLKEGDKLVSAAILDPEEVEEGEIVAEVGVESEEGASETDTQETRINRSSLHNLL